MGPAVQYASVVVAVTVDVTDARQGRRVAWDLDWGQDM
jgi:hypothetical protein